MTLPRPWLKPANFKKLMKQPNLGDLPFVGQSYIDLRMRPHPQVSCSLYLTDSSEFWRPFYRVKALKLKVIDAAMSPRLDMLVLVGQVLRLQVKGHRHRHLARCLVVVTSKQVAASGRFVFKSRPLHQSSDAGVRDSARLRLIPLVVRVLTTSQGRTHLSRLVLASVRPVKVKVNVSRRRGRTTGRGGTTGSTTGRLRLVDRRRLVGLATVKVKAGDRDPRSMGDDMTTTSHGCRRLNASSSVLHRRANRTNALHSLYLASGHPCPQEG